jgi:hypothetical protein
LDVEIEKGKKQTRRKTEGIQKKKKKGEKKGKKKGYPNSTVRDFVASPLPPP